MVSVPEAWINNLKDLLREWRDDSSHGCYYDSDAELALDTGRDDARRDCADDLEYILNKLEKQHD